MTDSNTSPIAEDDEFSVDEDAILAGNVLADNGAGADIDPDGDILTVSLISGPEDGALTLYADGTFDYQASADAFDAATPGEVIEQSFVYQIDDGAGGTAQATATIFVTAIDDGEAVSGGSGGDVIYGTDGGEDVIDGGAGDDEIYGLGGADILYGGNQDDMIDGGGGGDTIYGGNNADTLHGGDGDDTIFGGNQNDILVGGDGDDILFGENGADLLIGGLGDDELTGGRGIDTFVLEIGEGADTILDFDTNQDQLGLVGLGFEDLVIEQDGPDTIISTSDSDILAVLNNVDATELNETNVISMNY